LLATRSKYSVWQSIYSECSRVKNGEPNNVKIEEILMPDERVVKVQEKINLGNKAGMPIGDLYLTDRRLIFLHSKAWSMLSPVGPYV